MDELSTADATLLTSGTEYDSGDITDMVDGCTARRADLLILLRALAARIRAIPPIPE